MKRRLVVWAVVFTAGLVVSRAERVAEESAQPSPQFLVRLLLSSYELGERDRAILVLDQVRSLPDNVKVVPSQDPRQPSRQIAEPAFNIFAGVFANVAQDWLREAPPERSARRFLNIAAAVLEIENDRRLRGGSDGFEAVVEWICRELRQTGPTPFEHLWHLASIALGVGGEHLAHVASRFPNEPRFVLAQAVEPQATRIALNRSGIPPRQLVRRSDISTDRAALKFLDTILARLDALNEEPSVGYEARLRAGVIRFQLSRLDASLRDLSRASESPEPFIRQLAHLYRGLALSELQRSAEALFAYQAAHDAFPSGQSAALQFAAALFLHNRRDDAAAVAARAIPYPVSGDPWNMYGWGDYRYWDGYRARLRAVIER